MGSHGSSDKTIKAMAEEKMKETEKEVKQW